MPACVPHIPDLPPGIVIVVDKADFRLGVYADTRLMAAADGPACFPIALGAAPQGDKRRQGDEHTPEGWFRVTHKNPHSAFHVALGLNYPTGRHAEAAYSAGLIDRSTRDRVVYADKPGRMPVRDTLLGGDIYLHGGGTNPAYWTDGCVALADVHMDWLFARVEPGVVVWIRP